MKRYFIFASLLLALAASLLAVACGGDDDKDKEAVEAAALAAADAGDLETFLAVVTDNWPHNVFGYAASFFGVSTLTKDDLRAAAEEFVVGEPPLAFEDFQVLDVQVDGDSATVDASHREGQALLNERFSFVRVGETWLLDDEEPLRVEAPQGATEVEMGLVEFAFNLTQLEFPAGDIAFQASNDGQQPHEFLIFKLPEGVTLQQALEAETPEEEEALGLEDVAFFIPIDAGTEATWTVLDLTPGRYSFVCFVPDADDPEGTPHAFKGMVGEFTVQ